MNFKKSFFITKYFARNLILVFLLTSCAGTSRQPQSYYETDAYFEHLYATQNYTPRQKSLVATGKEQIGTPYVYGGTSPTRGFDCSGFTQYVYKNAIGFNLPRRAVEQNGAGQYIPRKYLLPGDLVFLNLEGKLSHVGIYIGEGRFFHASTSKHRLMVADLNNPYFAPRFDSGVRVMNDY